MELSERKKKVLRGIVDLYIRTAEPVGSKAIAELPDMNYSSATIRNEMAELTSMGYLEQPHTSAGRVPSAAGYRLYVDELMMDYRLSLDETKSINTAIEEKMQRVDKIVEKVAKLVSQATDLPAISVASRYRAATVKHFELILAGQGSVILVVMLSNDEVLNKLIKLPLHVTEADLKVLSAVLNATMTSISAEEFTSELLERVMMQLPQQDAPAATTTAEVPGLSVNAGFTLTIQLSGDIYNRLLARAGEEDSTVEQLVANAISNLAKPAAAPIMRSRKVELPGM